MGALLVPPLLALTQTVTARPCSCAVLGDNEGGAHVVDLRAGKLARPPLNLHNRKINTVHFEPGAEQVGGAVSWLAEQALGCMLHGSRTPH